MLLFRLFFKKLKLSIFLVVLSVFMGVIGFQLIENFNFIEAFYMSIITFSTVGFTEVRPLSPEGRLFTAGIIILNLGIFTYSLSTITDFLMDGEAKRIYLNYKNNMKIKQLKNHIIICGYGRNGKQAAQQLRLENQQVVVIESREIPQGTLFEKDGIFFIGEDATNEEALLKANIQNAKILITTLPKDADNIFVVLTAKELNPHIQIISRATTEAAEKKLKRAGCDHIVLPEKIGGSTMATLVTRPDAVEFFQLLASPTAPGIYFEEFTLQEIHHTSNYPTIRELNVRNKTGCSIIGIKLASGEYIINPSPDFQLSSNMVLILLGSPNQIAEFRKTYLI
ncbi:MAG: potassium channel protein [Bacteroidia bacterium]|nr:potassium channel protein [Bacteroidia bacterium]MDW8158994.1 potassium channel protein [Bacteroidia bacterium]